MPTFGLETQIYDHEVLENTVSRFRETGIVLPSLTELRDPETIPAALQERLLKVPKDAADPLNLFRVHWHNDGEGIGFRPTPDFFELPSSLTGTEARIIVLPADLFPMMRAHKVLASYGCLVPRLVTGQFDPTRHRAVWPSTGNYCRGGVAVSRILGCRGVAVLPEGMSRERFEWLEQWIENQEDVIRTPGSESNVREIYEKCAELDRDPENIIFNQFSEFGNYVVHYLITGRAFERVIESIQATSSSALPRAFVSATGSAGTIAAGDYLKEVFGTKIVGVEALECPTLLYNGYGEHNIQGIGDKHVPLIHHVETTDFIAGVSDRSTDQLLVLFNTAEGQSYLSERHALEESTLRSLGRMGLSSICNLLAAIKTAKYMNLGPEDLVVTVATDGAPMYGSEMRKIRNRDFPDGFDRLAAAEVLGEHLRGCRTDHFQELTQKDRDRIFNLGYFTWVEQLGFSLEAFEERRKPSFWKSLLRSAPAWDELIEDLNRRTGNLEH